MQKPEDENLNDDEELYCLLVQNAMDALVVCDEKGNYLYTSPSNEKLFGHSQDDLIGRNAFEFFHPEDVAINKERLQMLLEGKEFPPVEFRFKNKNGDFVWCEIAVKLVQTTHGENRIVVVAREVTERKDLQEKLRKYSKNLEELVAQRNAELTETKEYLEHLVNSLPLTLLVWDREFKINICNPEATRMFGFSEPELIGKNPASLFLSKEGSSTAEIIWNKLLRGEPANTVGENITKDGKTMICAWTNTPIRNEKGNLCGVLSMIQDVTEQKNLEERFKEITFGLSGVKAGESYLSGSLQRCLKIAFDLNSHNVKGLCIVRENPDSLIIDYNFKAEDIVLISQKPIKEFKAVNDLQEVAILITKFLRTGGGVVVLDGLEYLVSRFGFNPVFMMIQEKRFEFLETGATFLVPVDLETLEIREKGLLTSELKLIG